MGNTIRDSIINGNTEQVKAYLADSTLDINYKFFYNMTAIHYASQYGHVELVKELLERGASVNSKDGYLGYTPTHWASEGINE